MRADEITREGEEEEEAVSKENGRDCVRHKETDAHDEERRETCCLMEIVP